MTREHPEVAAARALTANALAALRSSAVYQGLDPGTRAALEQDLGRIGTALVDDDPYALALANPQDALRTRLGGQPTAPASATPAAGAPGPAVAATETLARRAGALADEVDFPAFVAGLVHGTFDAIVNASIRQMEEFASLVGAVAKNVDEFTRDNVTPNQVRDWLVERYPNDVELDPASIAERSPRLRPRAGAEAPSPDWLADFGLEGETLEPELLEDRLVPAARTHVGRNRLQMLATLVLLGMNRVVVRDGSVSARVRFRALARDTAAVTYTTANETPTWGDRGSAQRESAAMMVSTVGVNVQADTELKAELFGEVQINFASETLPLDRFVDAARLTLLERNARNGAAAPALPPAPEAAP